MNKKAEDVAYCEVPELDSHTDDRREKKEEREGLGMEGVRKGEKGRKKRRKGQARRKKRGRETERQKEKRKVGI